VDSYLLRYARIRVKPTVPFLFKVVPGAPGLVSMLVLETRSSPAGGQGSYLPSFQLRASSFDTSFDNDKQASKTG
jgi:hypothetical protein